MRQNVCGRTGHVKLSIPGSKLCFHFLHFSICLLSSVCIGLDSQILSGCADLTGRTRWHDMFYVFNWCVSFLGHAALEWKCNNSRFFIGSQSRFGLAVSVWVRAEDANTAVSVNLIFDPHSHLLCGGSRNQSVSGETSRADHVQISAHIFTPQVSAACADGW